MTYLDFRPEFKSAELKQLDLPIEIHDAKLKVIARTTSSQRVEVDPGQYYVTARLPAGHELVGFVEAAGTEATVALEPEPGEESPQASQEASHFLTDAAETALPPAREASLETLGPEAQGTVTLRRLTGNPFRGELEVEEVEELRPTEALRFPVAPPTSAGPALVELRQPGLAPLTVAVPVCPWEQGTVVFVRHPAGSWSLEVHLDHSVANLILRYRVAGYAQQAAETIASPNLDAEQLLEGKRADPVAAAVGAYALLRFADLERLHDWTANLYKWFDWFADAAAIRGEHLARLGRHDEAVAAFLEVGNRGLPGFADGVSFALDRLRLYLDASPSVLTASARDRAESMCVVLKRLAPVVDWGQPMLTIFGDPREVLTPSGRSEPAPTAPSQQPARAKASA